MLDKPLVIGIALAHYLLHVLKIFSAHRQMVGVPQWDTIIRTNKKWVLLVILARVGATDPILTTISDRQIDEAIYTS